MGLGVPTRYVHYGRSIFPSIRLQEGTVILFVTFDLFLYIHPTVRVIFSDMPEFVACGVPTAPGVNDTELPSSPYVWHTVSPGNPLPAGVSPMAFVNTDDFSAPPAIFARCKLADGSIMIGRTGHGVPFNGTTIAHIPENLKFFPNGGVYGEEVAETTFEVLTSVKKNGTSNFNLVGLYGGRDRLPYNAVACGKYADGTLLYAAIVEHVENGVTIKTPGYVTKKSTAGAIVFCDSLQFVTGKVSILVDDDAAAPGCQCVIA